MKNNSNITLSKELNVCQVRVDIIIAIYLYSNLGGILVAQVDDCVSL